MKYLKKNLKAVLVLCILLMLFSASSVSAVIYGDDLNVTTPVTYRLDVTGVTPQYTHSSNIKEKTEGNYTFTTDDRGGDRLFFKLDYSASSTYNWGEQVVILLPNAAVTASNQKYDVRITMDNMKILNYQGSVANSKNVKYISFFVKHNEHFGFESYSFNSDFEQTSSIKTFCKGVSYDIKIEIVDKNGTAQTGTYISSAVDIDKDDGEGNYNEYTEGVTFGDGYDMNTLHLTNNTYLVLNGKRLRGSADDVFSADSGYTIIANAQNSKFTWTGAKGCGTDFNYLYQPQIINVAKQDGSGASLAGAELSLYRGTELVEKWTSTGTSHKLFLNTGTYILKETKVPTGYNKASDMTVVALSDGTIKVNNVVAEEVVMKDTLKDATITVHHYLIDENNNKTTQKAPKAGGGVCDDVTQTVKYFSNYSTSQASVASQYQYVEVVGTPSGTVNADSIVVTYYYKAKNYNYTVNYYEKGTTTKIATSKTAQAPYGKAIQAANEKINISKYTYDSADKTSITISDNANNNVINLYYIKTSYKYTVNYLEKGTTTKIATSKESDATLNSTIQATNEKINIDGYSYDSADKASITIATNESNNVINLYYTKNSYGYTVNYLEKGTTTKIATSKNATALFKTTIQASNEKITINGFTYDSADKSSITIASNASQNVINLYYTRNSYQYTVNYLEKGTTTKIATSKNATALFGKTIQATDEKINIDGYSYDSADKANITISTTAGNNVINLYYTKNSYGYTVNYLEKGTTTKIATSKNATALFGTTIQASGEKIDIEGYTYDSVDKDNITITSTPSNNVINIYYTRNPYPYTINYLEKGTNEPVAESKSGEALFKTVITTSGEVIDIEGYEFDSADKDEMEISIDETQNIINIYYKKRIFPYTVNYLNKKTNEKIAESKVAELEFKSVVKAKDEIIVIPRYSYNSTDKDELTIGVNADENVINLYYIMPTASSSSKLVVKYVDKTTGKDLTKKIEERGEYGEKYTTERKGFEGYTLTEVPKNADGTFKSGTIEVVYYYEPVEEFDLLVDDDGNHEWYLRGYEDYTFRMTNNVTREEVATIFYRLTRTAKGDMRQDYKVNKAPYTDVEVDRWSARPIAYMKELGIMKGYPDGSFGPSKPITRAEFAQVIIRYVKNPIKNKNMFSDLSENHWASDAILIATNEGWIKGYNDGTFRPDVNISRVETVTIVNRMLKRHIADEDVSSIKIPVVDLDTNHWGYADVLEAITSHDYTKNKADKENWSDYRYPFHEDMSEDAYNDV